MAARRIKRKVQLKSLFDVQRFLSILIDEMRTEVTKSGEACKQAYVAGLLIKTFELTEIKGRIETLEARVKANGLQKKD